MANSELQLRNDLNRTITINRMIGAKNGFSINESTCVANVDYDLETETLTVEFQARGTYTYRDFPLNEYVDFTQAGSRGRFFNLYIRDRYSYEKVA